MSALTASIAIAGAGCVLPTGIGIANFWRAACDARSGITALQSTHFRSQRIAAFGHIPAEDQAQCRSLAQRSLLRYCPPPVVWGVTAAQQACEEAGLDPANPNIRIGLYSCQGGYTHPSTDAYAELMQQCRHPLGLDSGKLSHKILKEKALDPFLVLKSLSNGLLGIASLQFKLMGECNAFMQGVSGNQAALRMACEALNSGRIDAALVIAAGSELDALALATLARNGEINADGARAFTPFDQRGRGAIAGEGAVAVVLRRAEDAAATGGVYLDGLSYGNQTAPLDVTGCDLLFSDGRAIPQEDQQLALALQAFAARHVSSSQPLTGRLSAAPCLADLALARKALQEQAVPPIAGLQQPVDTRLNFANTFQHGKHLRRCVLVHRDRHGFTSQIQLSHTPGN